MRTYVTTSVLVLLAGAVIALALWMRVPIVPMCPNCGRNNDVIRIAYGLAGPKMLARAQAGEIKLGGCMVSPDSPKWHCKKCGREWGHVSAP
jgi:hypothetical protein